MAKMHPKTFFVLQVYFEMNLNMHMSSKRIEYVLTCIGRNTIHMYDKYIGPIFIQSSCCFYWGVPAAERLRRGFAPSSARRQSPPGAERPRNVSGASRSYSRDITRSRDNHGRELSL